MRNSKPLKHYIFIAAITITLLVLVPIFIYFKFPIYGIEITNDNDFKRYNFPGDGTESNPYRIENKNIKVSEFEVSISIYHTTKHFVIQDCLLEGGASGIEIDDIKAGTAKIVNCTIKNTNMYWGALFIKETDGIVIVNNSLISNQAIGRIESCNSLVFSNNYMLNNFAGLAVNANYGEDCRDVRIEDNVFIRSSWVGLYLDKTKEVTISSNQFHNSSIGFGTGIIQNSGFHDTYVIEDNYIDDKPIGFFIAQENLIVSEQYGQLFLFDCDNLTFVNQNFKNVYRAIYAYNCANLTILDSLFDASYPEYDRYGLYLYKCDSVILNNVTFIEGEYSFYYKDSRNINVQNCYFYNQTKYCIYLHDSVGGKIVDNYFMYNSSTMMIHGINYFLTVENNTIVTY